MQDNLGVGTHLATGLASLFQQIEEARPVGSTAVGVATVGVVAAYIGLGAPQHAVRYLVACLNHVRLGTSILQLLQTVLRVLIDLVGKVSIVQTFPAIGCPLLARIGPCVAIMEVEQEFQSCILDALAKCLDVGQVLAHSFVIVL